MPTLKATRPRPRVALLGKFEPSTLHKLKEIFSTTWVSETLGALPNLANPAEIDLIVIAPTMAAVDDELMPYQEYFQKAHIICFSENISFLPGPTKTAIVRLHEKSLAEEFLVADLQLEKNNLLKSAIAEDAVARDWRRMNIGIVRPGEGMPDQEQREILLKGALISDPHTGFPFAAIYKRHESGLEVAWLPLGLFNIISWVERCCLDFAKTDTQRFPGFQDWTKTSEWMTPDEESFATEILRLTAEMTKVVSDYEQEITIVNDKLTESMLAANKGKRRLITSQGDELVDEVAIAFSDLGYSVKKIDEEIEDKSKKREDLRIEDPDEQDWEALVEVRGHDKSSGQAHDLNRLSRYAKQYSVETRKEPSKLIYVINGQLENSSPNQRNEPFASAPEAVEEFGNQEGLIIWTLDFYKCLKAMSKKDKTSVRKSIRDTKGRWHYTK